MIHRPTAITYTLITSSLTTISSVTSFSLFFCGAADGVGSLGENHLSVPVSDHGAWATAMNNLGIMPMDISGQQLVSGNFSVQCARAIKHFRN